MRTQKTRPWCEAVLATMVAGSLRGTRLRGSRPRPIPGFRAEKGLAHRSRCTAQPGKGCVERPSAGKSRHNDEFPQLCRRDGHSSTAYRRSASTVHPHRQPLPRPAPTWRRATSGVDLPKQTHLGPGNRPGFGVGQLTSTLPERFKAPSRPRKRTMAELGPAGPGRSPSPARFKAIEPGYGPDPGTGDRSGLAPGRCRAGQDDVVPPTVAAGREGCPRLGAVANDPEISRLPRVKPERAGRSLGRPGSSPRSVGTEGAGPSQTAKGTKTGWPLACDTRGGRQLGLLRTRTAPGHNSMKLPRSRWRGPGARHPRGRPSTDGARNKLQTSAFRLTVPVGTQMYVTFVSEGQPQWASFRPAPTVTNWSTGVTNKPRLAGQARSTSSFADHGRSGGLPARLARL